MKIIFNPKSLNFQGTLGNKNRLIIAHDYLVKKYDFVISKDILSKPTIHSKKLIKSVKTGTFHNLDSPAYPNIFDYALVSINSAILAQQLQSFALVDPPGHHAGVDFLGGFCYFNNLCEAIYQSELKTLIIDIDGHHGNGTQDIVENNPNISFISLHRSPLYPGTGLSSRNNILNIPLDYNCGEDTYLFALETAIKQALEKFSPEQIAISAGFDTYKNDPLASLGLKKSTYKKIAQLINSYAKKTQSRTFAVLEGGYSEDLGELIEEFISGFED